MSSTATRVAIGFLLLVGYLVVRRVPQSLDTKSWAEILDVLDPRPWSSCTLPFPASMPERVARGWPWSAPLWRERPNNTLFWHGGSGCPHCFLVDNVAEWSGKVLLNVSAHARSKSSKHDEAACVMAADVHNLTKGVDAPRTPPTTANTKEAAYARWSKQVGPAPFVAVLTRAGGGRPFSTLLHQRASCPSSRQGSRFFHCQLREVARIRLGATELVSSASGVGPTALVLQQDPTLVGAEDTNIYHILNFGVGNGNIWCVSEAVRDLRRVGVTDLRLVADKHAFRRMSPWKRDLLALLLPLWSPGRSRHETDLRFQRIVAFASSEGEHSPPAWNFELDLAGEPRSRLMPKHIVARAMEMSGAPLARRTPRVLLLQRTKDRVLVDANSARPSKLLAAMCSLGVPVEMLSFDRISLREQVLAVSRSSVLIGVHGAHLVNLIFLQDAAAVVEVLLRTGWCCNPTQADTLGPDGFTWLPGCSCGGYMKGDYANLAHQHGLAYRYVDAEYIVPPKLNDAPIARLYVYVDAASLAQIASTLHAQFMMRWPGAFRK